MAELSHSGMVRTTQQIKDDRDRKGYCQTCHHDPIKCFEIKKRMGGMFTERIAITKLNKVHEGTCLKCNPSKDPRGVHFKGSGGRKKRPSRDEGHHRRQGSNDGSNGGQFDGLQIPKEYVDRQPPSRPGSREGGNGRHRRQGSYEASPGISSQGSRPPRDGSNGRSHRGQGSHEYHQQQDSLPSPGVASHGSKSHPRQGSREDNYYGHHQVQDPPPISPGTTNSRGAANRRHPPSNIGGDNIGSYTSNDNTTYHQTNFEGGSASERVLVRKPSGPLRQEGFINLAESMPATLQHGEDNDEHIDYLHELEEEYGREDSYTNRDNKERNGYIGGGYRNKQPRAQEYDEREGYIGGQYSNSKQPPSEQARREQQDEGGKEDKYVQEISYNIFNEPVTVKKSKPQRGSSSSISRDRQQQPGECSSSPPSSPIRQNRGQNRSGRPLYEEKEEEHAPDTESSDYFPRRFGGNDGGLSPTQGKQRSGQSQQTRGSSGHNSFRALVESKKLPAIPDLTPLNMSNNAEPEQKTEEEPMDALAMLIAQHVAKNPEEPVAFVPSNTFTPNTQLDLSPMSDDISVITNDTFFDGRTSLMQVGTSRRTGLTAISERSSGSNSSGQQRSMVSHQIKEPELGLPGSPRSLSKQSADAIRFDGGNNGGGEAAEAAASSADTSQQDMESYLENSPPHLLTLREMVGACTQAGCDPEAIDVVTQALIIDNATSMSKDLALFCLTTVWVLARKSDENKRKIIFEDATFEAIIEAMQIYRDVSDIQTRACGVLWSLSMDPNDRKHVAQGGGCESILNAMKVHKEDAALQVMALGALKVQSFDNIGKSTLRSFRAMSIVSDTMKLHIGNPTIQSDGCVVLGNLAVDDVNQFVAPVTENEVEVVVCGILAHPDSLEVHEAACFTLMSLASSASNVELIRNNQMSTVALEMAFQKHPDDVGVNILTLWRRLKIDGPR